MRSVNESLPLPVGVVYLKLRESPVRFGIGMNRMSAFAAGSIRESGI
jgi:hypothetical protein